MDASRISSNCWDTQGSTMENHNNIPNSKLYFKLGLKGQTNQNHENPMVLSLTSSRHQKHVEKNEKSLQTTQTKDVPTVFHGSRAPTITIQEYIDRIFKYSRCSASCFVVAQIYIDRLIRSEGIVLTSLNVHWLLITSVMVAKKFIDERFFNNTYYAKVGGVTRAEMNRLEMEFLSGIDFRLHVNLSTFEKYCLELMSEEDSRNEVKKQGQIHAIDHCACGVAKNRSRNNDDSSSYPTVEIHIQ